MKRIKVFGLAAIAALALSALAGVSAASATELFAADSYPATLSGTNSSPHMWPATMKCETTTLTGKMSSATTLLEVQPAYSKCTLGILAMNVNMNGCVYRFNVSGKFEIACPPGESPGITVTNVNLCPMRFPPQTIENAITYVTGTSKSGKSSIEIRTINGKGEPLKLTYLWASKATNCSEQGEYKEAYKGIWNVTGTNTVGAPINVFVK